MIKKDTNRTKVLPPDINTSDSEFSIEGENIRFGLTSLKFVGDKAVEQIKKYRPYKTMEDFFSSEISWGIANKRTIESLIKSGAFSSITDQTINELLTVYSYWNVYKGKKKKGECLGKKWVEFTKKVRDENNGKPLKELSDEQLLEVQKQAFSFYFGTSPLETYAEVIESINAIYPKDAVKMPKKKVFIVAGKIEKAYPYKTKKGTTMCFVDIVGNEEDKLNLVIWPEYYKLYKDELQKDNLIAAKVIYNKDNSYVLDETSINRHIVNLKNLKGE
jgi:DNA polymerase-3 subunit alpha